MEDNACSWIMIFQGDNLLAFQRNASIQKENNHRISYRRIPRIKPFLGQNHPLAQLLPRDFKGK